MFQKVTFGQGRVLTHLRPFAIYGLRWCVRGYRLGHRSQIKVDQNGIRDCADCRSYFLQPREAGNYAAYKNSAIRLPKYFDGFT